MLSVQSFASVATVTTSTGVVTHGAIVSNQDTVGWLIECMPSHTLADDPIVYPGQPGAAHLHNFWGNATTNALSTFASMEAPSNNAIADTYNGSVVKAGTSCDLSQFAPGAAGETASYWAPVVYGNGQAVTPTTKAEVYYRTKPVFGTGFKPFPPDTRLIVGNHSATSIAANDALANSHLYWECDGNSSTHYQTPPNSCASILMNVIFPSCYDNGPIDHTGPKGTDNQHFTYPVNGACPAGFSQKVPELSEKFKYTLPATGMNIQLSADAGMGMGLLPTYTAHADFWNTWNPASLQYLVDKCMNAGISCGTNPIVPIGAIPILSPLPSQGVTPTQPASAVNFSLTICPHGIGACGDNANPSGTGNNSPLHQQRNVTVTVQDTSSKQISQHTGIVIYTAAQKNFQGTVGMGSIPNGQYIIGIKMDGYLSKQVTGIIQIIQGQTTSIPLVTQVNGDINNDNQLDILDYNIIVGCFGSKATTSSCTNKAGSDINDDGQIDGVDYNLFLREVSVQKGV